jgi:cyclase
MLAIPDHVEAHMEQLSPNVFVETRRRGSNHGLVTTSDGIVMIDGPHKPSDALRLKAEIERRGPLRYIINTEPHGDHWTANAFFDAPAIAHEGVRARILGTDMTEHVARVATFGPEEPRLLEGYRPNTPVITFKREMTLHVGDHTFRLIHMPGHTAYQAAVIVETEGVVFTSDNVFCQVHTWLQEADPGLWLQALAALRACARTRSSPATARCATSGTWTSRRHSSGSGWSTSATPSSGA